MTDIKIYFLQMMQNLDQIVKIDSFNQIQLMYNILDTNNFTFSIMQLSELKQADQHKLNTLITNFGKTEANLLKFSQLTMLLLDRSVFSHRFTFKDYHQIFNQSQTLKNKKDLGKDMLQGERIVGREQLIYIFAEIGKLVFKPDTHFQDKFYNQFLSEKVDVNEGEFHFARVPNFDDINRKLFTQQAIQVLSHYQDELKHIYIAYMAQNYFSLKKSKRLLLTQREIRLQNKKWPFISIILFFKQSETIPHLTTIDHLQQGIRQIIPHTNQKQQQFYSRHVMVDCYQKQNEVYETTAHPGDPGMNFHEFVLLVGRVAWDCYPREMEKKNMKDIISRYFSYTFIRKNEDVGVVALPNMNRKMITKMKDYYKHLDQISQEQPEDKKKSSQEEQSAIATLTKRIKKQVMNAPDLNVDFAQTVKTLDKQLPKLPPAPVVVQQCPGPYDKANATTIGQQPPPEPVDKQKGAKQQKKGGGKDKQQVPARVFQWEDMPTTKTAIEDHLKSIEQKITFEVQPLNDIKRGTIRKQSYPVIIGETLFPGELPKTVVPHLKEASDALNNRNFVLALECYENGLNAWKKTQVQVDSASQLFFEYSKGNIYLSIGKLQYALQAFYNCRKFADTSKLPFNNPDRSLPYFGLGEVFYQMQQYALAARSFLKARQIRQNVLGIQHVQTATVFNNLACCFFMLSRAHEALGYVQIAEVVFDTQLGEHHERTMTCRRNFKKITGGTFDNQPQYRKFWEVFEEDKFEKKKKKKEKEGKKK